MKGQLSVNQLDRLYLALLPLTVTYCIRIHGKQSSGRWFLLLLLQRLNHNNKLVIKNWYKKRPIAKLSHYSCSLLDLGFVSTSGQRQKVIWSSKRRKSGYLWQHIDPSLQKHCSEAMGRNSSNTFVSLLEMKRKQSVNRPHVLFYRCWVSRVWPVYFRQNVLCCKPSAISLEHGYFY